MWAGSAVATNQDLSALFVLRTVERYPVNGGRFGFVMPWAVLRGRQFAGFRRGSYELRHELPLAIRFDVPWDLHSIKPTFFPVPSCVVMGERAPSNEHHALPTTIDAWQGRLPQANLSCARAAPHIERQAGHIKRAADAATTDRSPYHERFAQGATVVPRVLFVVEEKPTGPLGAGAGRMAVKSRRSATEKKPWKTLPSLEGSVDRQFVRTMHVGDTVLPYRPLPPRRAVIPCDGKQLLDSGERLALYPGLSDWWSKAEALWLKHRSSDRLTLTQQLDYQRKLSNQLPLNPGSHRVVYSASGMYMAAAIITDQSIIEHKLYWATASSLEEGRYLVAILNSDTLTTRVRPLQARGEHNPRDFDKYVWQVPIPTYDPNNLHHRQLASLGEMAEQIAVAVTLPEGKRFETWRRMIREAIAASDTGKQIELEVVALLDNP